jgi:signal transduction histidine kinase
MDGIIDALLTAARTELVRTVGRCELDAVLADFANGHRPVVIVDGAGLTAGVDSDIVTRILAPIMDNACRYALGRIEVRAHRAGHQVAVEVSNDGPLLPPTLAEQVFEPGFRARPDDGHDGAGLGLALARRLARAADGELVLDTSAARATFRLLLPAG